VPSSTRDSLEQLAGSSVADRVERLKAFSEAVAALARVAFRLASDPRLAPQLREEYLSRVESSLLRASAALSRGSYPVGARGLWSPGVQLEADVRKDSTPTSPTI